MRGFFVGLIVLAALEAAVSSADASNRAGALLQLPGSIFRHILSPLEPAIPDLRKHAGNASPSDNPFAQAQLNTQAISATWTTQSVPASLTPTTIGA